jgi:phosphatidate phosphatase PAH1
MFRRLRNLWKLSQYTVNEKLTLSKDIQERQMAKIIFPDDTVSDQFERKDDFYNSEITL